MMYTVSKEDIDFYKGSLCEELSLENKLEDVRYRTLLLIEFYNSMQSRIYKSEGCHNLRLLRMMGDVSQLIYEEKESENLISDALKALYSRKKV